MFSRVGLLFHYISLIFLITLFFNVELYPLNPSKKISQYIHRTWLIEDGLPQNIVNAVSQRKNGFLLLGTYEGFVIYDGQRFQIFDKYNTSSIKKNAILSILEDSKENVWIGTDDGLTLFRNGEFSYFGLDDGLYNKRISSIIEDNDNTIWIGTENGLHYFKDGKFYYIYENKKLKNPKINNLYIDRNENLLICTEKGLYKFKDKFISCYCEEKFLMDKNITSICENINGNLWVGTKNHGLYVLDGKKVTAFNKDNQFVSNRINSLYRDKHNTIWIGTIGSGICRYNRGKFDNFDMSNGLKNNNITSIIEDSEGSLWFGTYGGGLNQFIDSQFTHITVDDGLSNNLVRSVLLDHQNNLWVGTYGGGLCRIQKQKITCYQTKDGLAHNTVLSLFEDHKNRIWIGTYGGGLNIYRDGNFKTFSTKDGLAHNVVRAIYEDSFHNIWIGTWGGGINKYVDGTFITYKQTDDISANKVIAITEDKNGDLWFGTYGGGLLKYDTEKFVQYKKEDGLADNFIFSLYYDNDDVLWIGGVGNGLTKFENEKFSSYSVKDGLHNDLAFGIIEDNNKNLWMSCNKGIFTVNKNDVTEFDKGNVEKLTSRSYGLSDGMKTMQCFGPGFKTGAALKNIYNKVETLFFATTKGVCFINPENQSLQKKLPPVQIEFIEVNGEKIDFHNQNIFDRDNNNFFFKFTTCSFLYPKALAFRFKIEGFDDGWTEIDQSRRFAVYTNLNYGDYTFKVSVRNNDGQWLDPPVNYSFTIKPDFFETAWFDGLIGFTALFILIGLFRIRLVQVRRRERKLEELVSKQTVEIQKQAEELKKHAVNVESEKIRTEKLLLNILPKEIAKELQTRGVVEPVEYRMVSVLFTDFKGFTMIAEKMSPKELVEELDKCFDYFDTLMDRYNLEKLKTIGDSYMCAGGIPIENSTHPIDCILCATEIQSFMVQMKRIKEELGIPYWELRLGIHSGPLVAGIIGKERFTYDIWGDTVNVASRMETSGIVNRVNVSSSTYEIAKDFFTFEYRGKVDAKHKGMVDMYLVTGIRPELSVDGEGKVPNEKFKSLYEKLKNEKN